MLAQLNKDLSTGNGAHVQPLPDDFLSALKSAPPDKKTGKPTMLKGPDGAWWWWKDGAASIVEPQR